MPNSQLKPTAMAKSARFVQYTEDRSRFMQVLHAYGDTAMWAADAGVALGAAALFSLALRGRGEARAYRDRLSEA